MKKTQNLLWKFITAPEGVEKALKKFPAPLPIVGDQRVSAAERLDIYANMYFFRILDSLKEDFPAVLKILGANGFHDLIADYILKHPSSHWSLRYVGQDLPPFLKKYSLLKKWPYLSELAQVEWLLLTAFDAANAKPLTREDLSRIKPDQWAQLKLKLVPSFQCLELSWDIWRIRENVLAGKKSATRSQKTFLIVWRQGFKVFYQNVDLQEASLLNGIRKGMTFAQFCNLLGKYLGTDQVIHQMAQYLEGWINRELLTQT